ncbi:hypothetical protein AVW11_03905 [Streptomyces amritsarensis]|uniref:Uncharacterized protein n=1 Tax=Streptomyces amritsarensis TaxID=681158 RepID=A0ABX3GB39_9ACTN|nr:hypothetical protein [Streptomyces amritsarensis]OLZ72545.1 hypothetical protein AVW11_03905 [Streptomyces amritsarensis]
MVQIQLSAAGLLLSAADRIDANPHLTATAAVSAAFPRGILTMTVRAELAGLREELAAAERSEHASGLAASYHGRRDRGSAAHHDAARYASSTSQRATAARRALREAEYAAERHIVAALGFVGPVEVGTTRGQLADLLRAAASLARSIRTAAAA